MMKKILFIIALFILNMEGVLASSAFLENLEVVGYDINPQFEKYNNTYSLDVGSDIKSLSINYLLEDNNARVDIINNDNFNVGQNIVTINVSNEDETQSYRLIINKEQPQEVINPIDSNLKLEMPVKRNMKLIAVIIFLSWIFCGYVLKKILFRKRK